MKKIITECQMKILREHYPLKGASFCALLTGLSPNYIRKQCHRNGIKVNIELKKQLKIDLKNKIKKEKAEQRTKIREARIKQQQISKQIKIQSKIDNQKVNHLQFLNIKTPEVAYILGFLWADGWIYKNRITTQCRKEDLETIKHIFLRTGDWKISDRNTLNRQPQLVIGTGNPIIASFLKENGYLAKSGGDAGQILSKIPDNLKHYWFRGLIDGDGCFYVNEKNRCYQFSVCSTYDQDWTYFVNLCNSLSIRHGIQRRVEVTKLGEEQFHSTVRISNRTDIIKLGDYIYQGYEADKMGFPRKYEKLKLIKIANGVQC